MAIYDMHRSHATPLSAIIATRLVNAGFELVDALSALRQRRPRRMALKRALLNLSDATLADIGMTRADLMRL